MKHLADAAFWNSYRKLPKSIQQLADKNFDLLKVDNKHPSLHFKRLPSNFWSVRVGRNCRALAVEMDKKAKDKRDFKPRPFCKKGHWITKDDHHIFICD